jgi:hypothetical protein
MKEKKYSERLEKALFEIGEITTYRIVNIDDEEEVSVCSTKQFRELKQAIKDELRKENS